MSKKEKITVTSFAELRKLWNKPQDASDSQAGPAETTPQKPPSSVEGTHPPAEPTAAPKEKERELPKKQYQKPSEDVNALKDEQRKYQKMEEIIGRVALTLGIGDPLNHLSQCVDAIESKLVELNGLTQENRNKSTQLEHLDTLLKAHEGELETLKKKAQRQLERSRALRNELRDSKAEVEEVSRQLRSTKRRASKLERERDTLLLSTKSMRAWIRGLHWVINNGGRDLEVIWPDVVLVGEGPFEYNDVLVFLKARGASVWYPGSQDVPVMIVGTDDWSEEELEMQIAAQQGDELRVYSQEMALLSLLAGTDMLQAAPKSVLMELSEGHGALEFLTEGELKWPSMSVPEIPKIFDPFVGIEKGHDDRIEESPLKAMGYTVGKIRGLPVTSRKKILERAYSGNLPFVHSDEYMLDWGEPRTRRRLWRIAHHLAWLANSWKRLPNHRVAVSDWKNDIDMLEKQFFKPWMRFAWPKVKVPKSK